MQGRVMRIKAALDARAFRRAVKDIGNPDLRILDVGGGTGEISSGFVAETGGRASATVVDIDPKSIEVARSRGLRGFAGRIEDFETEERFDLILMLNLIEHVADPMAVLASARDHLDPGGRLWLQTPNFRALDGRIFRHRNWAGYHCPRHWAIFGERGLRLALERAGLVPVRFERTQGGPFWAGSVLGLRRARRPPTVDDPPTPLVDSSFFTALAGLGAGFDFLTRGIREVSQIRVLARVG